MCIQGQRSGKAELASPGVHAGREPSSYTSGLKSAVIWLAAPGGLYGDGPAPGEHAAGQPYHDPCAVAEPGHAPGIRTADQVIGDRDRHLSVLRLHEPIARISPARWVISSHPRSITPAEPTRLGTPPRLACTGTGQGVTQMAIGLAPSCPETGPGQAAAPSGGPPACATTSGKPG